MQTRQEYNIEIAQKILDFCEDPKNKDLRFGQILGIMNIVEYNREQNEDPWELNVFPKDTWDDESSTIYNRISASVSH
jgi:hypothetical protein